MPEGICPIVGCRAVSAALEAHAGFCEAHAWFYREVLADPYYRSHPVPRLLPGRVLQARLPETRAHDHLDP